MAADSTGLRLGPHDSVCASRQGQDPKVPDKPQKLVRQETCAVRQDSFSKVHDKFVTANSAFFAPVKAVRNDASQVFRDARTVASRRKKQVRRMRFFLSVATDLRVLNAAQIIYIFAALVIKKDVTVGHEKASPAGDNESHKIRPSIGIPSFFIYSPATSRTSEYLMKKPTVSSRL